MHKSGLGGRHLCSADSHSLGGGPQRSDVSVNPFVPLSLPPSLSPSHPSITHQVVAVEPAALGSLSRLVLDLGGPATCL